MLWRVRRRARPSYDVARALGREKIKFEPVSEGCGITLGRGNRGRGALPPVVDHRANGSIDEIVERSGLNSSDCLATLFKPERKGIVRRLPGKQFCKVLLLEGDRGSSVPLRVEQHLISRNR